MRCLWNAPAPTAALPLFQRALAIFEQALGPIHPSTAISLDNLAGLYRDQGDYAAALPLSQRALDGTASLYPARQRGKRPGPRSWVMGDPANVSARELCRQ